MNIRHIETFVVVVEKGSFSKAAQELFTTPSALTQQVNALERHLGFPLLNRDYRGATPTPGGQVFYERAKDILKLVREAEEVSREVAHVGASTIRLATYQNTELALLAPLLNGFARVCPDIQVTAVDGDYRYFLDQLLNEQIDLYIHPKGAELDRPGIGFQKLGTTRLCFTMAVDHPLASKKILHISDLANRDVIIGCGCSSRSLDDLTAYISEKEKTVRVHRLHTEGEVWSCVLMQGYLLANMSYSAKYHRGGVSVPFESDKIYEYGFVYRTPANLSIRRFLDYVDGHLDLLDL